MEAAGVSAQPPRRSAGRRLADLFHGRPRLQVGALLAGPVGWLVVAYLGSLAILFAASFWHLDDFTGKIELTDQCLIVSFNESVKSSSDFTDDTDRLDSFINGLKVYGGTALYDAVMYSLDRLRDRPGRKALVLLSDGDDTASASARCWW